MKPRLIIVRQAPNGLAELGSCSDCHKSFSVAQGDKSERLVALDGWFTKHVKEVHSVLKQSEPGSQGLQ
ncbi:MAG: hypothetical protein H0X25_14965 [Acidobacteriales bacterium]|nr:hypothetical protein [Terriglobales bacterium]